MISNPITNTQMCQNVIDTNPNMLVNWYLMASYLYYHEDKSLVTDELYDEICQRLLVLLPTIEHPHKHFIEVEALKAGTGYQLKTYPSIVKKAALRVYKEGHAYDR